MEAISDTQHTNGQRTETRRFRCGCTVEWSPNFGHVVLKKACPHSQNEKEEVARKKALVNSIKELVANSGCPESFKLLIVSYLPTIV